MSRSLGIFVRKYVCNDNIPMNGSYGHGHTIMRCHTDIWYQSSAHRLEYCDGMAGCEPVFCITPPIVTNEVVFDGHTAARTKRREHGTEPLPRRELLWILLLSADKAAWRGRGGYNGDIVPSILIFTQPCHIHHYLTHADMTQGLQRLA